MAIPQHTERKQRARKDPRLPHPRARFPLPPPLGGKWVRESGKQLTKIIPGAMVSRKFTNGVATISAVSSSFADFDGNSLQSNAVSKDPFFTSAPESGSITAKW